jgi:hypothetical protein
MATPIDRAALRRSLTELDARIAGVQRKISEQREVVVQLERAGRATDHAKYLLAGLGLLEAAYREGRSQMLADSPECLD